MLVDKQASNSILIVAKCFGEKCFLFCDAVNHYYTLTYELMKQSVLWLNRKEVIIGPSLAGDSRRYITMIFARLRL